MKRRPSVAILALAYLTVLAAPAGGQQTTDLQRQLQESRLRLEEIRAERSRLQGELEGARGGARDAFRELANVERQVSTSRSLLAELDLQLAIAMEAAERNSSSLAVTRDRHREATTLLHRRLRDVYKLGPLHTVRVLLGAESFADLLNRYRYVRMIATYDRSLVERVERLERELRDRDRELQDNVSDLARLRQSHLAAVTELGAIESEHQRAVAAFRSQESQAISMLESLDRDEERMRGLIDDMDTRRAAVEPPTAAPPARAAAAPPPSGGVAAAHLGTLEWPVAGEVIYRFGLDRRPDGTVLRWNGVGIAAPLGTPVRAVREGDVVLAGPFEGYGRTVVLSHGEGLYTLYLHLDDTGVVEGRSVAAGQVVGTVGGRDTPEGPHLQFQVRAPAPGGGSPRALDPLPLLRARPEPR